jgi:hypothetical protein
MGWMRWEPDAEQLNGGAGYDTGLIMIDTDQWGDFEWHQVANEWEDSDEWGSGSDQDTADAPKTADTAPESPQTPEQPTIAVSRVTPSKDTTRELLDTRIVPRALWAADEGLRQEQALQIVAVHDAGCVLGALNKVEAQRTMAAALLDWNKQATSDTAATNPDTQVKGVAVQAKQQVAGHTQVQPTTDTAREMTSIEFLMSLRARKKQQEAAADTQQLQATAVKAAVQTKERPWDNTTTAGQQRSKTTETLWLRQPWVHLSRKKKERPKVWLDKDAMEEFEDISSTFGGETQFDRQTKYLYGSDGCIDGLQVRYKDVTLEANSPRAGDDWAD